MTVTGEKFHLSGCPSGTGVNPDVLHSNTGCWSAVGPLMARQDNELLNSPKLVTCIHERETVTQYKFCALIILFMKLVKLNKKTGASTKHTEANKEWGDAA